MALFGHVSHETPNVYAFGRGKQSFQGTLILSHFSTDRCTGNALGVDHDACKAFSGTEYAGLTPGPEGPPANPSAIGAWAKAAAALL